ncbi:hypothetical protein BC827DRAFT_1271381 [Russula dissimulans]|nr:hypothetical protein BC827DRAFT_1271381 [Russula dissimulans]
MFMDRLSDDDSSYFKDHRGLDFFEEIVEPSDLKLFSIFLKEAHYTVLETQHKRTSQKTYTGPSWSTKYCRKRLCTDLISKGFLPLDQFMKHVEDKKLTNVAGADVEQGCINNHSS